MRGNKDMIDGIPVALFNGVTTVGLVVLLGIGFATSRLYTRAQVLEMQGRHAAEIERLVKAHEREIDDANHERGEWRTEARLNQQAVIEQGEQITALTGGFEVLRDFLAALRRVGTLQFVQDKEPS